MQEYKIKATLEYKIKYGGIIASQKNAASLENVRIINGC